MTNQPTSNSLYPVANGITSSSPFIEVFMTRDPTTSNTLYPIQKRWFNTLTNNEWILVGFTASNGVIYANWQNITTGGGTITETLTGNSGGAVGPSANNINTAGSGSITIVGNPSTNTLTTQLTGLTAHDVLVGAGTATITSVSPSTAGFVLTSNGTSADPSFQTISASGAVTSLSGDTGTATPNAGAITVSGGTTGLTTTGSSHTLTLGGTLGIANGGTDATSFTQTNGIVTYNGTRLVNYAGPQISSAGVYTNTSQPCFMVYLTTAVPDVSGDTTNYALLYDTTQFDQASNVTLNSGGHTIFTAPVTGKYLFCGCINFNWTMGTGNASVISTMVVSSGTIYRITEINQFEPGETSGETFSLIIPLTAAQTVYLTTSVTIAGGGKTAVFRGIEVGITMNFWSGDLVC